MAESYGSDVVSVLAWLVPQTETIQLGAAIMQVPARAPAAAAMAGCTIDALSGGRFIFGFGPSGPAGLGGLVRGSLCEALGPDARVRRDRPQGGRARGSARALRASTSSCRCPDGEGKALKLNFHPVRNRIPIFLGAIGRKSVELAAEIADGWIPIFSSPDAFESTWGEHIEAGLAKGGRQRSELEISPTVQVAIDGDLDAARAVVKAGLLLYLGGMGSRKTNFYVDLTHSFGFGEVADEVQALYLDGKREDAYNAIPDELVDATSLVGDEAEVADRLRRYKAAGVDRLIVSPISPEPEQRLHTLERLAELAGVAEATPVRPAAT